MVGLAGLSPQRFLDEESPENRAVMEAVALKADEETYLRIKAQARETANEVARRIRFK